MYTYIPFHSIPYLLSLYSNNIILPIFKVNDYSLRDVKHPNPINIIIRSTNFSYFIELTYYFNTTSILFIHLLKYLFIYKSATYANAKPIIFPRLIRVSRHVQTLTKRARIHHPSISTQQFDLQVLFFVASSVQDPALMPVQMQAPAVEA